MDMQNVKNLAIPEGDVKMIHDKDNRLLWGAVGYDTKYAGDTTQQTYSGKNLLKNNATTTTLNDVTFTVANDGTISLSGVASAQTIFDINNAVELSGTYTLSGAPITGSNDNTYFLQIFGSGGTNDYGSGAVTSNINGVVRIVVRNGVNTNGAVFKPMIESGSFATTYEPYVGGTASPNPDYPQAVNVVTGTQTVIISDGNDTSASYTVGLTSKNLFDSSDIRSGDIRQAQTSIRLCGMQALYLKAGTYTFSTNLIPPYRFALSTNNVGAPFLSAYPSSYIYDSGWITTSSTEDTSITFNTPSDGWFVVIFSRSDNGNLVPEDVSSYRYQLEAGSKATTYQQYYNYELCKIGTYQDYIYKSGDDWYVHKATGKAVFDGIEAWTSTSANNTTTMLFQKSDAISDALSIVATSNSYYLCNSFKTYNCYNSGNTDEGSCYHNDRKPMFRVKRSRLNTEDTTGWQTWLSTHNTTVYYVLATPTDTKITDSTLIGELEAVHEWMTRYGYQASVTGNLPMIIRQDALT